MKILVIGGGGREHALAFKAAESALVTDVFVAPGNAGTALEPKLTNVDIAAVDNQALSDFALSENIGVTIVGPVGLLVACIVVLFRSLNLVTFGSTTHAVQFEHSIAFI